MTRIFHRVREHFRPSPALAREIEAEFDFHLQSRIEDFLASGLSLREARNEALRRFGPSDEFRRECLAAWGAPEPPRKGDGTMKNLLHDFLFAARSLRKNPAFAVVAVLTLALGIGTTTAIFSVVYGVLFRPLPFTDPDRLVLVQRFYPPSQSLSDAVSVTVFDYSRRVSSFSGAAAFTGGGFSSAASDGPQLLFALRSSSNLLSLLGVRPVIGRLFTSDDDSHTSPRVVLLSNQFWRARFGSDPSVLGRHLDLSGSPAEIVGVLPDFSPPPPFNRMPDIWVPLALGPQQLANRSNQWLFVVARLRPDVTLPAAQSELDSLHDAILNEEPGMHPASSLRLDSLAERPVRTVRRPLLLLLGAVALVLLIACTNVSSLLLARGSARQSELAVRAAIGAGRARLVSLLLSESLLVSLLAGVFGFLCVSWFLKAIVRAAPSSIPRLGEIRADFAVFAFALAVVFLSTLLSGLLPALHATRVDLAASLRSGMAAFGSRRAGLRRLLVVPQVALALVLLVGSSLLLASFLRLVNTNPGYDTGRILTISFFPTAPAASAPQSLLIEQSIARVRSLPSVEAVAATNILPLSGSVSRTSFRLSSLLESPPSDRAREEIAFDISTVSSGYFSTFGIPVCSGREFLSSDAADPRNLVVISESLARRLWPGEDAAGKVLRVAPGSREPGVVIGVVGDVRSVSLETESSPTLYRFSSRVPMFGATLVIRTSGDPAPLASAVRDAIRSVDPNLVIRPASTMEQLLSTSVAGPRFYSSLFLSFALIALVIAAVGLYGLLAWLVARRTQEMGIRCALGATPREILRLVLREGLRLVAAGLVLGVIAAFALTRLLTTLLYDTRPTDPLVFVAATLLLFAVAFLACWLPARRAARLDPLTALRYE